MRIYKWIDNDSDPMMPRVAVAYAPDEETARKLIRERYESIEGEHEWLDYSWTEKTVIELGQDSVCICTCG